MIPYGKQSISEDDIEAVVSVLRSDYLTQGPELPKFENAIATKFGALHAVAVNSATSALHIACMALGLGDGDVIWTSPNSFVASANCGLYCGAKVDFVDVDPNTFNISIEKLHEKLKKAEKFGALPKILVAVHFGGAPCDMLELHRLLDEYDVKLIEDASHAVGAKYRGEYIGNCRYSDITVMSFHPVKIITTGEGGIAITNNEDLLEKMRLIRSHGITRDQSEMTDPVNLKWYYEQVSLGYNYRMCDIQAALGLSQLKRLDAFVEKRTQHSILYSKLLSDLPIQPQQVKSYSSSSWHLYAVKIDEKKCQLSRDFIFKKLHELGVLVNVHYIPIHTQPHYKKMGFRWGDFPNAEAYFKQAISLPMYADLQPEQVEYVCASLEKVLNAR